MSWLAQAVHVMRKDMLEHRWLVAAYVAVVGAATARAVGAPALSSDVFAVLALVVVMVGMVLVASVVQSDSPSRADAFWASRPFHPTAMLAAKLGIAAFVAFLLAVLGQLAGLAAVGVGVGDGWRISVGSAAFYAAWLLLALVLAALTRDLKGFALGAIGSFVIVLFMGAAISAQSVLPNDEGWRLPAVILGLIGGVMLAAHLYRTRDLRRRRWLAMLPMCALTATSLFAPTLPSEAPPALAPDARLAIELQPADDFLTPRELQVVATLPSMPADQRLSLSNGELNVQLRNGSAIRVRIRNGTFTLSDEEVPLPNGARWIGAPSDPPGRERFTLTANLTAAEREAMEVGIVRVTLTARVTASRPRIAGTIPLARGASMVHEGGRVRVDSVRHAFGETAVTVHVGGILQAASELQPFPFSASRQSNFVLLNESRNEVVSLRYSSAGGSGGWLVLPTRSVYNQTMHLVAQPHSRAESAIVLEDEWLRGARLGVLDWTALGSYPVTAELAMP